MARTKTDALLDLFTPDELHNALWYIDVFERWNMPAEEADEWRRRIVGRREFVACDLEEPPRAEVH